MTKLNFTFVDFYKLLKTNIRFMENLEKKIENNKYPDVRVYVSMNILSKHKLITNISNFVELQAIIMELNKSNNISNKLRFVVHIKESESKIIINFPIDNNNFNKLLEKQTDKIKKISLEYYLLYDAADKNVKKANKYLINK